MASSGDLADLAADFAAAARLDLVHNSTSASAATTSSSGGGPATGDIGEIAVVPTSGITAGDEPGAPTSPPVGTTPLDPSTRLPRLGGPNGWGYVEPWLHRRGVCGGAHGGHSRLVA